MFSLIQVHSLEDRDGALKHDRGYIGKRYVTLRVVSEQSMKDLLARSAKVSLITQSLNVETQTHTIRLDK